MSYKVRNNDAGYTYVQEFKTLDEACAFQEKLVFVYGIDAEVL